MPFIYDMSVPVFVRALENLSTVLKKGEKWCEEKNVPKEKLLESRIFEDMYPLPRQVQTASNTAKNSLQRLDVMEDIPKFEDNETTFPELYARIEKTVELLKSAKPEAFEGKESHQVVIQTGAGEMNFTGLTYLQRFGLPNFFFHHVTAYDILRAQGVPVGKLDYLRGD